MIIAKVHVIFFPVLIDFGKAFYVTEAKMYTSTPREKEKYRKYHEHIAPELVRGTHKQLTASDIYSFGRLVSFVNNTRASPSTKWQSSV